MDKREMMENVCRGYMRELASGLIGSDLDANKEWLETGNGPMPEPLKAFLRSAYNAAVNQFDHGDSGEFGGGEPRPLGGEIHG